jgi:hypothetical protein
VSQAKQVAVRPTIALLILHCLVRQIISLTADVPTTYGIAQTTAPTTQSIYILGEVEQVSADTADLGQVLEGQSLGFRGAVSSYEGQRVSLASRTGNLCVACW